MGRRRSTSRGSAVPSGVLVVDKPAGLTSFAVVQAVRRILRADKVGHTGTLDPLATGVLPVCLEGATRIAGLLLADDKLYLAGVLLGVETDTLDVTGEVTARANAGGVSLAQVEAALQGFVGEQDQVPPVFSALHVDGERAHERARRGEVLDLPARRVTFHRLELRAFAPPRLELLVDCSKGTYVRSLVRDLGRALGCGAAMESLRRLRSGSFDLSGALTLEALKELARLPAGEGGLPVMSMDQALAHLPAVDLDPPDAARLGQGQPLDCAQAAAAGEGALVRARAGGELMALGEVRGGRLWPRRVFHCAPPI